MNYQQLYKAALQKLDSLSEQELFAFVESPQPAAPLSSLPDWQENAVNGAKKLGIRGGPPLAAFMDGADWMLQHLQAENTRLREQLQAAQPPAAEIVALQGVESTVWKVGNHLRVTTKYDLEVRDKSAPDGYRNDGRQVYEGEVVVVDYGLALKTNVATFKTQGSYWFGSIIHQDVEVITPTTQTKGGTE